MYLKVKSSKTEGKSKEGIQMKPMLLTEVLETPIGEEWMYETKYDGFRCMLVWDEQPMLISRNGNNLTHLFPEILDFCKSIFNNIKSFYH